MWSGIWFEATIRIGFWTWNWSIRDWNGTRIGLLISMLERFNWFCLTSLIALVLLMWKWMGLLLRKNHLLRSWSWLSLVNWIKVLTLPVLAKLLPRELELWFVLWSVFLLRLLCNSVNLPYDHAWNTLLYQGWWS